MTNITTYTADTVLTDETVSVGYPRRINSGNGQSMIPLLVSRGGRPRGADVYDWLPLTATKEEQEMAVSECAKRLDAAHRDFCREEGIAI